MAALLTIPSFWSCRGGNYF